MPPSETTFVWRCGSVHKIADRAQLDRLMTQGLARHPVLTVAGPPIEPAPQDRPPCGDAQGRVCPEAWLGDGEPVRAGGVPAW